MIVVPIILHSARTGEAHPLATITISNDGSGTATVGHYDWTIRGKDMRPIMSGRLNSWPRKARPVYDLVQAVLAAAEDTRRRRAMRRRQK